MKEKSLVPIGEISIFEKIKNFFRKIFVKDKFEEVYISEQNETSNYNIRDKFKKEKIIIELQQKYENGMILEGQMSEEERNNLLDLYKKQIEDLENKIIEAKMTLNNYKNRILEVKRKVEANN